MDYVINSDGVFTPTDELQHWGIKGMKWGRRLYQNKDGSLTPLGKKRYAREEAQLKEREKTIKNREREAARRAKLDAKKADLDAREQSLNGDKSGNSGKSASSQQRGIKDLSDDELRNLTTRMTLEKNYLDAQKNLSAMTPEKVSAGKQFMDKYGDKLMQSLVVDPAQKYLTKALEKKLGLEDKDPLTALKRKADEAKYKKEIAENQKREREANAPSKKERTADELIDYLSGLEGDDLTKLADAATRADQYQKIINLLKKEEKK